MRADSVPASERLVTAATDLFYQKGFRAVSIEEIVERAGVTKMSLYRLFASKDVLGAACLTRLATRDIETLSQISQRLKDDPVAQIRAIVSETASRIADLAYRGWPMSNLEIEVTDRQHPARQVCEHYKAQVRDHLHTLCAAADFCRPDALADGLLLIIEGASTSWHSFGPEGPAARLSQTCETLMAAHGHNTGRSEALDAWRGSPVA